MNRRPEELAERYFEGNAASYDHIARISTLGLDGWWKRKILKRLPKAPDRILEQASGTGILTCKIAQFFPECRVIGVELHDAYLNIARTKVRDLGLSNRRYALKIVEESRTDRDGTRILRHGTIDLVAKNNPGENERYRVERGVTKSFRIKRIEPTCAKYGWTAENSDYIAVFCGATQGIGAIELTPKGAAQPILKAECDSADVD